MSPADLSLQPAAAATLATASARSIPSAEAVAAVAADTPLREDERQRCEVWTRVMGYHRPVSSFNTGKKGEFAERQCFEEARARARTRPLGAARQEAAALDLVA